MGCRGGGGGEEQGLIKNTLCAQRLPTFRQMHHFPRPRSLLPLLWQVDGGVDAATVAEAAACGANVIVAGTAILGAKEPGEAIRVLRAAIDKAATTNRA